MDFKESKFFNQNVMSAARQKERERGLLMQTIGQLTDKVVRIEETVYAQSQVSKDLLGLITTINNGVHTTLSENDKKFKEQILLVLTAVALTALAVGLAIGLVF